MKKSLFVAALLMVGFAAQVNAQNGTYRNTVSGSSGLNAFQLVGLIDRVVEETDSLMGLDTKGTASWGLQYDRALTKWFSLGGSVAYNKFRFNADKIITENYNGPISANLTRTNISLRPLFHYANRGRIDLYTGFRFGANIWNGSVVGNNDVTAEEINESFRSRVSVGVQFIPFGMRAYVTEHIGLGFEFGFGAPHYAAAQLNYRF